MYQELKKKGKRDILAFKLSLLPVMVEGKALEADIFVHVHITVIQNTGVVIPAIYKKKTKKNRRFTQLVHTKRHYYHAGIMVTNM